MAHLEITPDVVVLRLSTPEKVAALRGDLEVPLADVEAVEVVDVARRHVHGIRLGTGVPGLLVAGTFGGDGDGETVAVCHGNGPGVLLTLRGTAPRRVVVTVDDPQEVAARVRAATSPAPRRG